jgi:hypothetical protein
MGINYVKHFSFYRVLTTVYNTQNYWVFGLFPSSGILENRKHGRFGNWICFRPQVKGGEDTYSVGPLRMSQLLRLALSKGPN